MRWFDWLFGSKGKALQSRSGRQTPARTASAAPPDLHSLQCSECGKTGSAKSAMTHSFDGRAVDRFLSSIGQCPRCKRLICGSCSRKLNYTCPQCHVDFVNL